MSCYTNTQYKHGYITQALSKTFCKRHQRDAFHLVTANCTDYKADVIMFVYFYKLGNLINITYIIVTFIRTMFHLELTHTVLRT